MAPASEVTSVSRPVVNRVNYDIKCVKCRRNVRNGILCDVCDKWSHFKCANISENNPPDENIEWACPTCTTNAAEEQTTQISDVESSLQKVIDILQQDILDLKLEISELRKKPEPIECNDMPTLNKVSGNSTLHRQTETRPNTDELNRPMLNMTPLRKPNNAKGWETITYRGRHKKPSQILDLSQFPPLSNRYQVLNTLNEPSEEITIYQQENPPKKSKRNINIKIFSDSQGRLVATEILKKRPTGLNVTSEVKPNARFEDATANFPSIATKLGSDDLAVFLAGTNDVARNELKNLLASLRQQLLSARGANVLVFSVPHRHDLAPWSCVNAEVKKANDSMKKICKYFRNVTYIDISSLGIRFHTAHGLHLNKLGKRYVAYKIKEVAYKLYSERIDKPTIPLKGMTDSFLGMHQ